MKNVNDFISKNIKDSNLPFNYSKWKIIKGREFNNNLSKCICYDYMTSAYEIIPFYKPIINIPIPNERKSI